MSTPRPNPLSTVSLNRLGDKRKDEGWIAEILTGPAHVHLVANGQIATIGDRAATLKPAHAQQLAGDQHFVFLGEISGTHHFSVDVSHVAKNLIDDALHEDAMFMGLRDAAAQLQADDANLLAFATGMAIWHNNHRHCGRCGQPTEVRAAGHERHCNGCGYDCFPRTDPAMIVLVHNKSNDRCVLGRQKIWPARMFSTLAGFLEPGESLEDCVAREVFEEVGLLVDNIHYISPQPWPFPQSLMVGFHATAVTEDLAVHPTELDDAQWFSREQVADAAAMGRRGDPMSPPPQTISRRLIDEWLGE